MNTRLALFLLALALALILSIAPLLAQTDCPALVNQALDALSRNCSGLERNSACYGFDALQATFAGSVPADFFTRPADRAPLTDLRGIRTAALDLEGGRWGIAVLQVLANVPNTLPGQAVTFLLMGDAELQNAVTSDSAFVPANPVEVTVTRDAPLLGLPDAGAETLASVIAGTVLQTDAQRGGFVRVAYDGRVAWLALDAAAAVSGAPLANLPAVDDTSRTPMQAFVFSAGVGQPTCEEAPSALVIQSPQNIRVDLTVNGAAVSVGSLVVLQQPDAQTLRLRVIEGSVETADGQTINAGEGADAALNDDGSIRDWGDSAPLTPDELGALDVFLRAMGAATTGSGASGGTCVPGQTVLHTVAAGENLFRIALLYDSTVSDIATANNLADARRIFVGQQLSVPCGSRAPGTPPMGSVSTSPQLPPLTTPAPGGSTAGTCPGLRPTSPLGTMPLSPTVFYWDGTPDADRYVVTVYGAGGVVVGQFSTQGNETNVRVDVTGVGGRSFAWDVAAYRGGQELCRTAPALVQRDEFPPRLTPVVACINTFVTPCNAPCTLGAACPGTPAGKTFLCTCP